MILFVVVMAMVLSPGWTWPRGGGRIGLAMAAALLLVHAQIEMTFFHDGAVIVAWVLMATAAGSAAHHAPRHKTLTAGDRARQIGPSALLAVLGVAIAIHAGFVARHQTHLRLASNALRVGNLPQAIADLTLASSTLPRDAETARNLAMLQFELSQHAWQAGRASEAREMVRRMLAALDQAEARGAWDAGMLRLRARAQEQAARILSDPQHMGAANADWQRLLERTPYSMQDAMNYADLLWRLDRRQEAGVIYARVLELDRQAYLDPAKQLDERARAMVTERLGNGQ